MRKSTQTGFNVSSFQSYLASQTRLRIEPSGCLVSQTTVHTIQVETSPPTHTRQRWCRRGVHQTCTSAKREAPSRLHRRAATYQYCARGHATRSSAKKACSVASNDTNECGAQACWWSSQLARVSLALAHSSAALLPTARLKRAKPGGQNCVGATREPVTVSVHESPSTETVRSIASNSSAWTANQDGSSCNTG